MDSVSKKLLKLKLRTKVFPVELTLYLLSSFIWLLFCDFKISYILMIAGYTNFQVVIFTGIVFFLGQLTIIGSSEQISDFYINKKINEIEKKGGN